MARFISGNHVQLLRDGGEFFPALISAVEAARHEIHIETYIFRIDATTLPLVEGLLAAAARGVAVCVLLDGFGSRDFPPEWRRRFAEGGVELMFFRADIAPWPPRRNRLRRMHRKVAVVDARVAFIGGINLHDDCDDAKPGFAPRYDYAVRVEGPVLVPIYQSVHKLWLHLGWLARIAFERPAVRLRPATTEAGRFEARFVVRDNLRNRQAIELEYLRQIQAARREIIIANAYFLPGLRLRRAIRQAAVRGVRVVLLLQGRPDFPVLQWATRMLYRKYLEAGVEIFEYRAGYMHAKVAVVDTLWATVGSSNIDPFSLGLAREANLVVKDYAFARELKSSIDRRIRGDSMRIELKSLARATRWQKLWAWMCYGLARFGINIAGLGEYYGKE